VGAEWDALEHDAAFARTIQPTMRGFVWRHSGGGHAPGLPGDSWCIRDSFCQLFGWEPASWEWEQFRELPHQEDLAYLEQHLGLIQIFSREPEEMEWFAANNAHRGVVIWRLTSPVGVSGHATYAKDLRNPGGLLSHYRIFRPVVDGYLVDVRQAPG